MKMNKFIKLTAIGYTSNYSSVEDLIIVNINDIARIERGGITFKTPYPNGDHHVTIKETPDEILKLINHE